MNLEQLHKIYDEVRKKPIRTSIFLIILALVAVTGMWASGFFGKLGEEAAIITDPDSRPNCEKFGITIDQKSQEVVDLNELVVVSGTAQSLPTHLHLWVAATMPGGSREFFPRDEVFPKDGRWKLETYAKLKHSNDVKRFAVFIVGEDGHKFIAAHIYNMGKAASKDNWAPLNQDVFAKRDIVRCHGIHKVKPK